ncbi:hypothetical protein H4R19_006018 [Coemansia spiralis]|nr:hypothetical protein H4R19_006018 [Coemansia spiralis]
MGKLEAQLKADGKPGAAPNGSPKPAELGAAPAAEGAPLSPQPQGDHGPAKRQHSMMDVDRGPRSQQQQQQQQQQGNGDGAGAPEQRDTAAPTEAAHSGAVPADAAAGGPASSLKKRHRQRNRVPAPPVRPPPGAAPKRGKSVGAERPPRAKDT